jgi:hypothetical protein
MQVTILYCLVTIEYGLVINTYPALPDRHKALRFQFIGVRDLYEDRFFEKRAQNILSEKQIEIQPWITQLFSKFEVIKHAGNHIAKRFIR